MLEVSHLNISLPDRPLIKDLSFSVSAGQVLALLGPSGSGKSTVLDWMVGLSAPGVQAKGALSINGQRLDGLPCEQRRLGLMTQTPLLFPHLDVLGNLKFGARNPDADFDAMLVQADLAGLGARDVATLSGGQVARVSLLRTLLSDPVALFLDEPFSRLDAELRSSIRQFVWERSRDIPVVLVTHDPVDIPAHAQTIQLADYTC